MSRRAIVYDVTHLVSRLTGATTAGIDWVDRAYARYLTMHERISCGLHYGAFNPHLLRPARVAELSDWHERKFHGADLAPLEAWLTGEPVSSDGGSSAAADMGAGLARLATKFRARLAHDRQLEIPQDAIYLNVAQHGFEYPRFFAWLERRSDVQPVFFVHDMLPLDHPEYFRPGYEAVFRARVATMRRYASAIIATSQITADRIAQELASGSGASPLIHVAPLPSPLEWEGSEPPRDARLAATPYFVAIGAFDPRKNYPLLLDVWQDLAQSGRATPKLVCVGAAGRESSGVLPRLQRLSPYVRCAQGLSAFALRRLLANARALLAPSFAEGYGIPIVEALSLGVPVLCSDIPIFHEVAQERAVFLSLKSRDAWRETLREFAADGAALRRARAQAEQFRAPSWEGYFAGVEAFFSSL